MQKSPYPGSKDIHRHLLPNGIVVLIYENHTSQSVVIDGLIRVGALAEANGQAGLSSFTSAMLMRGTEKRPFSHIYETTESIGASMGFSSGYFSTGFAAKGLAEDFDLLLDLLAQSLRQPIFPAAEVEKMRGQYLTALHMRADNTQQMASLRFHEALYPDHPYGRSTSGYFDSINAITREQVAAFHADYYHPQGLILTVVGGIDAANVLAGITAVFGNWHHPTPKLMPVMPPAHRPRATERVFVELADKSQSDILIGLPAPMRSAPDYLDASLMNTILGVFGMMGRIGQVVREQKNLAYYAYSRLQGGLGPSPMYAAAGVAPDKVDEAIDAILGEIERMRTELVPLDELADSQAYRTGSMPVGLETNDGLAGIITDMELYELGFDYLQRFADNINAITPERIRAAAQTYWDTEQLIIAVAGSVNNE